MPAVQLAASGSPVLRCNATLSPGESIRIAPPRIMLCPQSRATCPPVGRLAMSGPVWVVLTDGGGEGSACY